MVPLCILICFISSVSAIPSDPLQLLGQTVATSDIDSTPDDVYQVVPESTDSLGSLDSSNMLLADGIPTVEMGNGCVLHGGVTLSCDFDGDNNPAPPVQVKPPKHQPAQVKPIPQPPAKPAAAPRLKDCSVGFHFFCE